ncbi:winged helix-turn-helix domain-containing protein [Georgenia sp. Z1491]|uniref:winged helix-turn-helix domain-containing protein n=1 Tax=Georgenia sp. Z1491 TaxID=3416707 RepID=UPI003CF139AA
MKAFAHPLRMAMYDYLNDHEAATATTLARHTGESTGQTSYHLRQLARHGLVEEVPGRGTGRERWWSAVGFRMDTDVWSDPRNRPAVATVLDHQITQRARAVEEWLLRAETGDGAWTEASVNSRHTATMTSEETRAMRDALMAVLHEHSEAAKARREDGESAAAGPTRRVRVYLDVFPLPED